MSTAGYGMKFSKGYLGGGKEQPSAHDPEPEEGEGHEDIHEHLRTQHERTGHAHSHVEHHGDGTHTSHHIDAGGNVEGPHEHGSDEELMGKMQEVAGEGEPEEQPEE